MYILQTKKEHADVYVSTFYRGGTANTTAIRDEAFEFCADDWRGLTARQVADEARESLGGRWQVRRADNC